MREADTHIAMRLREARRRLVTQRFVAVSACASATLVLGGTAVLFALSVGWRGPWVYWVLWLLGLSWGGAVLWSALSALWRLRSDERIAQLIESRDPRLQDALLASVDFGAGRHIGAEDLSEALSAQVASTLSATELSVWFPWSALKRVSVAVGLSLLVSLAWWSLRADQLSAAYRALSERPELITHRRSLTPLIGDIKLLLTPPAYTQEPPKALDFGSGDFEALIGTQVTLEATLTRPAREVELLWLPPQGQSKPEEPLPEPTPVQVSGRSIRASFAVSEPCAWRVRLTDLEGVEWIETVSRQVLVRPDLPPKVKLLSPVAQQEVDPRQAIDVKLSAQDDFGLSTGELFLALNTAMEHPERQPISALNARQWSGEERLDLQLIEAQGGDTIALWAEVRDNRATEEGTQLGRSEVIYLKVSGIADQHHALLDQLREHMEAQLTSLADRLTLTFEVLGESGDAPLSQDAQAKLLSSWMSQRSATESLIETLTQLITQQMAEDELTPKEIYLAFVNRLERYEEASRQEARAVSKLTALNSGTPLTVTQLDRSQAPLVAEVEATIILIEAMLARLALDEMADLARELKERRERLRAMMEEYKRAPSEELKARIKRELERFKRKMAAMREAMKRLQKKLPKEFLNLDGLKSDEVVDSLEQTASQLDSIEKMLDEGRMEDALKALDEMSEALDAMSDQLQKDQQELHEQTNPELDKALSELMDQTRDLMRAQAEVSRDAQAQQEAMDRAQQEALERQEDGLIKEIKERLAKLKSLSTGLSSQVKGEGYMLRLYEEANKAVVDLERSLEQALLPEALGAAERSESGFESLERSARSRAMYGRNQAQDRAVQKDATEAKALSGELLERLERLRDELGQAAQEARRQAQERQAQARAEHDQQGQPQQSSQGQAQPGGAGQPQPNGAGEPQPNGAGRPQPSGAGQPSGSQGQPSLSQRQGQISRGVQSLRERLEAKRDKTPSLHQVPDAPFDQALEGSREAERELRQQPGRGRPGQQRVEDALGQIMEGLKQSKSPSPSPGQKPGQQPGGQRSSGQGRDHSTEKVELPETGERRRGSLREDLVEAMKDKPAQGYDDQVKAYYESLVR